MKSMSVAQIEDLHMPGPERQERDIVAVVHRLRNQASTLALGINVLKYPAESELERQQHLAQLEAVVGDMAGEFRRLDHWLIQVGYKRR
jgi:hypothetical protein